MTNESIAIHEVNIRDIFILQFYHYDKITFFSIVKKRGQRVLFPVIYKLLAFVEMEILNTNHRYNKLGSIKK